MADPFVTIAIVQSVLRYGPGIVLEIAKLFDGEEEPTPEQIRALKITKDPKDYFNDGGRR